MAQMYKRFLKNLMRLVNLMNDLSQKMTKTYDKVIKMTFIKYTVNQT